MTFDTDILGTAVLGVAGITKSASPPTAAAVPTDRTTSKAFTVPNLNYPKFSSVLHLRSEKTSLTASLYR